MWKAHPLTCFSINVHSSPFICEARANQKHFEMDSASGSHSCKSFNILFLPFPVKPTKSLKVESDTSTSTGNPSITLLCFLKIRRQSHIIFELPCLPRKTNVRKCAGQTLSVSWAFRNALKHLTLRTRWGGHTVGSASPYSFMIMESKRHGINNITDFHFQSISPPPPSV